MKAIAPDKRRRGTIQKHSSWDIRFHPEPEGTLEGLGDILKQAGMSSWGILQPLEFLVREGRSLTIRPAGGPEPSADAMLVKGKFSLGMKGLSFVPEQGSEGFSSFRDIHARAGIATFDAEHPIWLTVHSGGGLTIEPADTP